MDFFSRIEAAWAGKRSLLCVGLDPVLTPGQDADSVYDWGRRIVDETLAWTACYKPNIAFYEALGPAGLEVLARLIAYIPAEAPVLLDAKRGDIGSTAEAYAQACFNSLGVDAVTLSPYLGRDSVDPFLAYPDKNLFLLARTSNPRAAAFQDLQVDGQALYCRVAAECCSWSERIGLVVAGNDARGLAAVRATVPEAWFLSPGIGAQGGDIATAWRAGARADGLGIIPVVARAVAQADQPGLAARGFAEAMLRACEGAAGKPAAAVQPGLADPEARLKSRIMQGLIDTGCFKTGNFTLKSGKQSPFYIDLRRVIASPDLLDAVAEAYARVAAGLDFDRIAGIPAAALPLATALSLKLGKPMVWPRMPAKEHGTGVRVEGEFRPGETVLLLDDLITTGTSKLEAIAILRGEGLKVQDLAVLIERGRQGRIDMAAQAVEVRAFFHVRELFALCQSLGLLDGQERIRLEAYADAE